MARDLEARQLRKHLKRGEPEVGAHTVGWKFVENRSSIVPSSGKIVSNAGYPRPDPPPDDCGILVGGDLGVHPFAPVS